MQSLVVVLVSVFAGTVAAAPMPPQQPPGLRQTLQQYHSGSTPAPRQLSPVERAELRRQLTDYRAPARRR